MARQSDDHHRFHVAASAVCEQDFLGAPTLLSMAMLASPAAGAPRSVAFCRALAVINNQSSVRQTVCHVVLRNP
jgi:hypothetical protein